MNIVECKTTAWVRISAHIEQTAKPNRFYVPGQPINFLEVSSKVISIIYELCQPIRKHQVFNAGWVHFWSFSLYLVFKKIVQLKYLLLIWQDQRNCKIYRISIDLRINWQPASYVQANISQSPFKQQTFYFIGVYPCS